MQVKLTSQGGIDYLVAHLRDQPKSATRAILWRIPHNDLEREDIRLKVGRYARQADGTEKPESITPKSELTLDDEEFRNLIEFLEQDYAPFRAGESKWIAVTEALSKSDVALLRRLFARDDIRQIVDFVLENQVVTREIYGVLQQRVRERAVAEFRDMLAGDLVEHDWQAWFKMNDWVLGTDIVRVIDDRRIDTDHVADYLVEAHDGFLDVVEIKRPEGGLRFWAEARDRGNLIPATGLVKAITQTTNYLHEIELEADSVKFEKRIAVPAVKPRATLIYGRSESWGEDERLAYRILNRSFHSLSILTFDHVLARAERVVGH